MPPTAKTEFDYVIVGSGAAGSVLAERLSRDPATRVLVLEAGGSDSNPLHRVPKGFFFTMTHPRYTKTYVTEPYADGKARTLHRGRVIGGSTTINGMIWNRGWAPQYDAWEAAGIKGWNWNRFLEAYRAIESHELGGDEVRGGSGPLAISRAPSGGSAGAVSEAFLSALERHGIETVEDLNGLGEDRAGFIMSNIRRGSRISAARAFLRPAAARPNVTVRTRTEVHRILFSGTTAYGVEATRRGRAETFTARREVLVCAGAIETPLLLERSGIGDPHVLETAGVPVVVASSRVGENLQDHRGIAFQVRLKGRAGYNREINTIPRKGWAAARYLLTRRGVIAFGAYDVGATYTSDPGSAHPDTSGFFTPISASATAPNTGRLVVDHHSGAMFTASQLFPTSSGSIHITGPATTDAPRIRANYLATEHDRSVVVAIYRKAREILNTDPFAAMVDAVVGPAAELVTDEEILDHAVANAGPGFHTVGTCAVGPSPGDVLDERLQVRGASALRVIDASAFPNMPSGNNGAPTLALAWIAADILREDACTRSAGSA